MAEAVNPDDYAVVIGVDHYPNYNCLRGAVADATEFKNWLLEADGGGLDPRNCLDVFSPPLDGRLCTTEPLARCRWSDKRPCRWYPESEDASPKKSPIDTAVARVNRLAAQRRELTKRRARRLYFYFAGHGKTLDIDNIDLILADYIYQTSRAALASRLYRAMFVETGLYDEVIFFLDCCRNWVSGPEGIGPEIAPNPLDLKEPVFDWVAFATQYKGSREAALADGESDGNVRGIFTHVLLEALRGAAAIPGGGVNVPALMAYLEDHVPKHAQKIGMSQTPDFRGPSSPRILSKIVFGRARPVERARTQVRFETTRPGRLRLRDPEGRVIHEGDSRDGRWELELEPNTVYAVEDEQGALTRVSVPHSEACIMSPSERPPGTWPFVLFARPEVLLTVVDGRMRERHRGYGGTSLDLPPGLYLIRKELGGVIEEEVQLHRAENSWFDISPPSRYSPAPLSDTATHRLIDEAQCRRYSTEDTATTPLGASGRTRSRLFLYLRATDPNRIPAHQLARELSLFDPAGNPLPVLDPEAGQVQFDDQAGYLVFAADAEPGPYLLRHAGPPGRELTVHLFSGWQTQLYLLHGNRLHLDGLKVFMVKKGSTFYADEHMADLVDLATECLQNGTDQFPVDPLKQLLHHKFVDPMLGLIGTHILLRDLSLGRELMEEVIGNLDRLVPDSVDLRAIRILAARRFGGPFDTSPVTQVPMLRAGFQAVIDASYDARTLIPPGGLIDQIAPRLHPDSPWTSWEPLPAPDGLVTSVWGAPDARVTESIPLPGVSAIAELPYIRPVLSALFPHATAALRGFLTFDRSARPRAEEWIEHAVGSKLISELRATRRALESGEPPGPVATPGTLARDLGVTLNNLAPALQDLSRGRTAWGTLALEFAISAAEQRGLRDVAETLLRQIREDEPPPVTEPVGTAAETAPHPRMFLQKFEYRDVIIALLLAIFVLQLSSLPLLYARFTGPVDLRLAVLLTALTGSVTFLIQPGFALLVLGLTRTRNALQTAGMNLVLYAVGMLGFWACGFALMLGGSGVPLAPDGSIALDTMKSVTILGRRFGIVGWEGFFLSGSAGNASGLALFITEAVFVIIAATIPTGALAERWKTSSLGLYGIFFATVLYPIYGAWAWGNGWLTTLGQEFGFGSGFVDVLGSSFVHMTGGVTALAGSLVLGPRIGKFNKDGSANAIPGRSLPMAILGTLVVAAGWLIAACGRFAYDAANLTATVDPRMPAIATTTTLAAAAGCLTALAYAWLIWGAPDVSFACNGLLAGVVAISACAPFVNAVGAVIVGAVAGPLVVWSVYFVEDVLKVDDPVGAISVHGLCGVFGCMCAGLFATGQSGHGWNGMPSAPIGLFYGGGIGQFNAQAIGVLSHILFVFPTALVFFWLVERTIGNRIPARQELADRDLPFEGSAHDHPDDAGVPRYGSSFSAGIPR